MDAQRIEDITEWDARSFSDGFSDLRGLADRGFSGAVTDGTGWLLLLNGRIVGVVDAALDDFADASGTAYQAPDESLPLLFAMQEAGGTQRARYYTNDTPLSEADQKLSAGGFTGYVELSENVLSGDYYVTYTGGESRTVAFVGNSRRLETGDHAFDLADDEVGIYTVYEVDLDVRELPDATAGDTEVWAADADATPDRADETDESAAVADAADETNRDAAEDSDRNAVDAVESSTSTASTAESDSVVSGPSTESAATADSTNSSATDEPTDSATSTDLTDSSTDPATAPSADVGADGEAADVDVDEGVADADVDEEVADADVDEGVADADVEGDVDGETDDVTEMETAPGPVAPGATDDTRATESTDGSNDDVFSEEEEWREATSIPALDPQESTPREERAASGRRDEHGSRGSQRARGSASSEPSRPSGRSGRPERPGGRDESGAAAGSEREQNAPEPRSQSERNHAAVSKRPEREADRPASGRSGGRHAKIAELESALEEAEREREELSSERDALASERDEHEAERERLEREVEQLTAEVGDLRTERDRLREELSKVRGDLPDAERTVPADRARNETNLFIRYESKSGATLEDVHGGDVDRDALRENLQIEHHTGFESEDAVVDGLPFREFLEGTMEYGFTRWLVEDLSFEVRDTGNEGPLRDLYDALPKVDRAEIGGSVSIVTRENGEENREQRTFDLVLRDRMGNPLFIADLNASRDPTAGGTLESLVANGGDVAQSNGSFAATFAVTASFFEPDALEAASDAVGGGLFSRSKRKSFVKISRKQGYHLCLVESRDGGFHLTVPDL